ncbi:serine/threonine protein kinase [Nonomuraea sediminis]|uniref:serine/threonine protein kinase n=1 Tax=Nonomuraea sediminis TaxID=2835864 RepID=UPI001BDCE672|nr:serine/threonine protein kinase [Nonomuraea sediminis]
MISLTNDDPRQIGPYRIVGRLGEGGMGVVFAGRDPRGERVAVKLVHTAFAGDPEFRARFAREIALLGRVRGVCTARILASDAQAARPWLAAEYVPGPTLEEHGPLQGDGWFGLVAGMAEALVSIHAVNVVHRDIKPSNVILSPGGPKLVDFGIARALDGTSVTRSGQLIGTPGWVSPEEYRAGKAGPAADVYGWGLLAVYAATGRPPYGTGRPEVLAHRVLNDEVDTAAVPEPLRGLVGRALSKDPAARPSTDEVMAAVSRAWSFTGSHGLTLRLGDTWVLPQEEEQWPSRGKPRRTAVAFVAAAVVLGVGAAASLRLIPLPISPPENTPTSVSTPPPSTAETTRSPTQEETPTQEESPTPTKSPEESPTPEDTTPKEPRTSTELAAALELALENSPAADFSFEGGFTQSDTSGTKASGSLESGSDDDDTLDMRVEAGDETTARHTVRDGAADGRRLTTLTPADQRWYALMVAGTASPSVIRDVVANSSRMRHNGHTYSGTLDIGQTSGRLRFLLDSWMSGDAVANSPRSYLTFSLSIDDDGLPERFRLTWCVPTGDAGVYRSEFSTEYSDWRSG